MTKRYTIYVRYPGQDREVALCEVDACPEKVADILRSRRVGKGKMSVSMYEHVYVHDNQT